MLEVVLCECMGVLSVGWLDMVCVFVFDVLLVCLVFYLMLFGVIVNIYEILLKLSVLLKLDDVGFVVFLNDWFEGVYIVFNFDEVLVVWSWLIYGELILML